VSQESAPRTGPRPPAASAVFEDATAADGPTIRKLRIEGMPTREPVATVAAHEVRKTDEDWGITIGQGASLARGSATATTGFVRSWLLDRDTALVLAAAEMRNNDEPSLRLFGVARRSSSTSRETPSRRRRASVYPVPTDGPQLDAYWVHDCDVASESLPSGEGMSIAGAGDRPRRFFRGHRFRAGAGMVASVRCFDPAGGSFRVSVALPAKTSGAVAIPSKTVLVAVTELGPDGDGRIQENAVGEVALDRRADGTARLHLALDVRLRSVGGERERQRVLVFGDFDAVGLEVGELTPWLGRFHEGRPLLEPFAAPGDDDR